MSSGCLGRYEKPSFNPLVNESSKGLNVQGQTVRKASISEDFWTASTCDMDNSAVQSQGSISSISTSNQTLDLHGSVATANAPAEFVNHGKFSAPKLLCLILWNQIRQRWVGNRRSQNRKQLVQEPKLNHISSLRSAVKVLNFEMAFSVLLENHFWMQVYSPSIIYEPFAYLVSTHCLSMVKQFWLCSWNATYENLLGSNKPFPQPIPLSEMIDFLVDVWEQEGLYD
ncbi:Germin-like protein subfamily 1 member 15 [Gossypium australe]|uniref:Germin-like protein subfamily 1 member 15 n=1 Tax=Gossypium australe TaxID=47621 RepID=A0A5B6WE45_9ROSI|nr:Germin-like protein subfamily 1 member 15 [Gossypium australe]